MAHSLCKTTKELLAVITDEGCVIDAIKAGGKHWRVTYSKGEIHAVATLPRASKVNFRYPDNLRRQIRQQLRGATR